MWVLPINSRLLFTTIENKKKMSLHVGLIGRKEALQLINNNNNNKNDAISGVKAFDSYTFFQVLIVMGA